MHCANMHTNTTISIKSIILTHKNNLTFEIYILRLYVGLKDTQESTILRIKQRENGEGENKGVAKICKNSRKRKILLQTCYMNNMEKSLTQLSEYTGKIEFVILVRDDVLTLHRRPRREQRSKKQK